MPKNRKYFSKKFHAVEIIDLFDVWRIDFMGHFKNSHVFEHILVMVDYVSKWVEAMPCHKASMKESIAMIKSMIFSRFGTSRILISDGGTHFTGKNFKKCLSKLGIEHRISMAYHPQTNGQAETSNRQLKSILNKTIEKGGKDWSKN
jgi:transposase InsO family protein